MPKNTNVEKPKGLASAPRTGSAHRNIADSMGFEFDEKLPAHCLNKHCFTEQLFRNVCDYYTENTNYF